jgi:uncharacterized caspase-like protein
VRWGWRILFGLVLWCGPNADAMAEKRVALIIGNSAYQHAARLANPSSDATAIAKLFKDIGFEVVDVRRDLVGTDLRRAIREFSQHARGADIAVVFYAGHGIELNGTNYLVPTDGKLEQDFDVEDETVPLDRLLAAIEPAKRLRVVILDACRDNPFVKRMKRTVATRAIGQGLAKVEPASSDTLIAFAAKAGSIANDGEGPHSPFTTALLKHLPSPAVDVRLVFGRVRDDVLASTRGKQEPFVYGSLGGSDVALVPAPVAPAPGAAVDARHDYELAERVGTLPAWDAFLARYATGFYANLAREQRSKLLQAQAARQRVDQEASRKRDDERKLLATRLKTEADAKRQREDEERRAKAAEAAEQERAGREKVEREKAEREKTEELARIERERTEREWARREEVARADEEWQRRAREQAEREKSAAVEPPKTQVALLPPASEPAAPPRSPELPRGELIQAIKKELKRVGCYTGAMNDGWGGGALTRSIKHFVKYAKFSGTADEPSSDFLEAVRASAPGVCPIECGARETERNGRCVAKTCPSGERLSRSGACVEVASRPEPRRASAAKRPDARPGSEAARPKSGGGHDSAWRQCARELGPRGRGGNRRFTMIDACVQRRGRS